MLLAEVHPEEALEWAPVLAAELRPQEPRYLYTLAFYEHRQGRGPEAVLMLDKLLAQGLATAEAYGLLGRIFEEQHQADLGRCRLDRRASQNGKLSEEDRAGFAEAARRLSSPP